MGRPLLAVMHTPLRGNHRYAIRDFPSFGWIGSQIIMKSQGEVSSVSNALQIPSQSEQQLPRNELQQQNGHTQPNPIQRQKSVFHYKLYFPFHFFLFFECHIPVCSPPSSSHSSSHPTQFARVLLKPAPHHLSRPTVPNVTQLSSLPPHSFAPRAPIMNQRLVRNVMSFEPRLIGYFPSDLDVQATRDWWNEESVTSSRPVTCSFFHCICWISGPSLRRNHKHCLQPESRPCDT